MILGRDKSSGAYFDAALHADADKRRWTGFVAWEDEDMEEIDVDSPTKLHATEIVRAALARDYQPGGIVVEVAERTGLYL